MQLYNITERDTYMNKERERDPLGGSKFQFVSKPTSA